SPKACFTKPCPQYDCVENPCNLVDCQSDWRCIVTSGKAQCVENNIGEELSSCAAIFCAPDTVCQAVNGRGMCVDKTVSDNRTITCSALLEDNNNAPNVAICAGNKQSWRYNRFSSSCEQVTWSGCGKNDNIFATQDECNQRCAGVEPCPQIKPAPPTPGCEYHGSHLNQFLCPEPTLICSVTTGCEAMFCTADSTCQVINGHAQCVSLDAGDSNTVACSGLVEENTCAALPKWRYNRQNSACESITWTGCSSNQNLFNSKEECDQKCSKVPPCPMLKPAPAPAGCEYNGTELNQRLCPVPKLVCNDNANCAAVTCLAGDECKTIDGVARCVKSNDGQLQTCSQLPEMGPCQAFMPRWYYNRQTSNCQRFNYSGCEGNENNFASIEDCEQRCIGVRPCPIIDPMAPPTGCRYEDKRLDEQLLCPVPKLVCDEKAACAAVTCSSDQKCVILTSGPKCVPTSPANCTVNVTVGSTCPANSPRPYYFNAQSGKCEQSIWKECEGENLFATIKLCERQCIEQRPCYPPPVAAPPAGCNYEISNDSEGCPTVFNLRCPNGQAPVS
uniref:BPTI/Kunitz inhibitor domain-containing protein n=1 Tax=Plectus sambesii TaxID=2011161 RepID=A0A914X9K8_9BILA